MNRVVIPEILDSLDPSNPDAIRSRRDLTMINRLMGGQAWLAKEVGQLDGVHRVVELGAGDGMLCNQLKSMRPNCEVIAIDLIPKPAGVRDDVVWEQMNVLDYEGFDSGTVVIANLFIHHLQKDELRILGSKLKLAKMLLFTEPHRTALALCMGRCLFPIVNYVTRHDMITSIRAGFVRGEMGELFGEGFRWQEKIGLLGGIRMTGGRE
mgnify:CR=1 FL=1